MVWGRLSGKHDDLLFALEELSLHLTSTSGHKASHARANCKGLVVQMQSRLKPGACQVSMVNG